MPNPLKFKTARTSELRAILARARAKAEQPNGASSSSSPSPSLGGGYEERSSSRSESEASSKSPSPTKSPLGGKSSGPKTTFQDTKRNYRSNYDDDSEDEDIVEKHFDFSNHIADDDSDDSDDTNKGTLGRMLKQKQREMLRNKK